MTQRAKGVVHIGWPDGYFTDPDCQLEVTATEAASWQLSGYLVVTPPSSDGQEHSWNEPCPACGRPADNG
jgi:hypothetical protein